MEYKDYYKILGVPRTADADQIKRAYRKLARKFHPDVSKEPNAEARFKEINEANEVLKDPEKRAAYDALGTGWRAGEPFRPPPGAAGGGRRAYDFSNADAARFGEQFSEFFENLFGARARGAAPGAGVGGGFGGVHDDLFGRRGADQSARVQVTLEEAYAGATRQLRLEVPEVTADGRVERRARTLNVRIPAGVVEGQQIRLAGQGGPAPAAGGKPGEAGDLYLEIEFAPHPVFRSEGRDIHLHLPIAPWEAALGATVPVPTLGGTVSLRIPPNAQSNQRLRLKGRGLPGKPPGDAFVQLEIVNPPASDEAARGAFSELANRFPGFNPRARLGV